MLDTRLIPLKFSFHKWLMFLFFWGGEVGCCWEIKAGGSGGAKGKSRLLFFSRAQNF